MKEKKLINELRKRFKGNEISLRKLSQMLGYDFNETLQAANSLSRQGIIETEEINEIGSIGPLDIRIMNFYPPKKDSLLKHPIMTYVVYPLLVVLIIWGVKEVWVKMLPKKINITPQEIVKHLFQTDSFLHQQRLAEQLYIGKYVEWKIKIDQIFPGENSAAIIRGDNVQAIFSNRNTILPYKKGMTLVVFGRIVEAVGGVIVIDKCKIKKIK